ncbi:hypothetical protein HMPREF1018_02590, partial [Bacteroides fragilis]
AMCFLWAKWVSATLLRLPCG